MANKEYKEIGRTEKIIILGSGNERELYDIETGEKITRYNVLVENINTWLKRGAILTGLGLLITTSGLTPGFRKQEKNLETRTSSSEINLPNLGYLYDKFTFFPKNEEKTEGDIEKARKNISSMKVEIPEYINPTYVRATFFVESSDSPHAESSAGAMGLPQTYFSTWKEVFPEDTHDDFVKGVRDRGRSAEFVFRYSTKIDTFLKNNMPGYNNLDGERKRDYIAAAYNCGMGNLRRRDFRLEHAPKETKNHIRKIRTAYRRFN
jgi:hypothetical protein